MAAGPVAARKFASPSAVPFTVKTKEMEDDKVAFLEQLARELACKGQLTDKEVSGKIKQEMDKKFGSGWHVIVGRDFGARISHMPGSLVFFYVGFDAVVVFKFV